MIRPSLRSYSNIAKSIIPSCPTDGMRGSGKRSCDGVAGRKKTKDVAMQTVKNNALASKVGTMTQLIVLF